MSADSTSPADPLGSADRQSSEHRQSPAGRRAGSTVLRPAAPRSADVVVVGPTALADAVRGGQRAAVLAVDSARAVRRLAGVRLVVAAAAATPPAGPPDHRAGPAGADTATRRPAADPLRFLELRARTAGVPLLRVTVDATAATLGPLSRSGSAGCGHCAAVRIGAAGRDPGPRTRRQQDAAVDSTHRAARLVGAAIVERIADLRTDPSGSDLVDHVLRIDLGTGGASRHRVVPLADCPVCGGARAQAATPAVEPLDPTRDLDFTLAALAGWLDPYTGVVSRLDLESPLGGQPDLPYVATAAPPRVPIPSGGYRQLPAGWGKGPTPAAAIVSAVCETVERYSAATPDPTRLRWAAAGELTGDVLEPPVLGSYRPEQYARAGWPYPRYEQRDVHPWVRGRWLGGGRPVWVPAVAAFLAMELAPHQAVAQGTSNGLAAGTDLDDAATRATLELLERDALLAAWQTGRGSIPIELSTLPPQLRAICSAIAGHGATVEVSLLATTACGVTALAVALGDGRRWPGVTLGLGADLHPAVAVEKAVLELAQTGPYLRRLLRDGVVPVPAAPADVREMLDHAAYYFPAHRAGAFDRVRGSGPATSWSELTASRTRTSPAALVAALAAAGVRVAVVDVTAPDVATGPFRVVRAVSPDLQTLSFGYGLEREPTARIRALGRCDDAPPVHPVW